MDADPPPRTLDDDDDADRRLRRALLDLPADADEARLAALNRRVMAQWEAAQCTAAAGADNHGRPWLTLWGRGGRAPWMVGAVALTAGLAVALHAWLRAPDPTLEELLQPDVLSQMAAGEM